MDMGSGGCRCTCGGCAIPKKKAEVILTGKTLIDKAANFIKPLEGFVPVAYWDFKQFSYGYGSRAEGAGSTIDEKTASSMLMSILANNLYPIESALKVAITENQKVALLSFDYNLGFGNTKKIIDRINAGKSKNEVAEAIKLYVYAGGKINDGLVKRREKEAKLYLS